MKMNTVKILTGVAALAFAVAAQAQVSNDVGEDRRADRPLGRVLGSLGPGSVEAVKMAVEDFGGKVLGKPIEIVFADHQNKGDIAANKAREWFDRENVDIIVDLVSTSTALAVMKVAKEKNKISVVSGAASTKITNEDCTDTNVHWTYDTRSLAEGTGRAVVKQGGDTWFS